MQAKSESEMLHRAATYCSAAERCIYDVRKKIENAGISPESIERIIDRLIKENFINEARFCRSFVNDKLRFNKWGRIKIGYELRRKGIAQELVDEALNGIDENEYRSILTELLKRKRLAMRSSSDADAFLKLCRFAASKGFEKHLIVENVKSLCGGEQPDDDWE